MVGINKKGPCPKQIGDFIKKRIANAGYECQFIEKPANEIQSLLDKAAEERLISGEGLETFEFGDDAVIAALQDADAFLLITEWREFRSPDWSKVKSELKNPILNSIMKKSFELGLSKIAKSFEERAVKLYK